MKRKPRGWVMRCRVRPFLEDDAFRLATALPQRGHEVVIEAFAVTQVQDYAGGNKEVNEAIATQLGQVMQFAELPLATRAELSRRMAAKHPGSFAKKVFYGVTGGEAIEIAIKLARWYTGKTFILTHFGIIRPHIRRDGTHQQGVHERVQLADSGGRPGGHSTPVRLLLPVPDGKIHPECDLHCATQVKRLFQNKEAPLRNPKTNVTNVAAFVIEPFQASRATLSRRWSI